jgi:hypothetical protein
MITTLNKQSAVKNPNAIGFGGFNATENSSRKSGMTIFFAPASISLMMSNASSGALFRLSRPRGI